MTELPVVLAAHANACPLAAPVVILTLNAAVVAGLKTVAMKIHLPAPKPMMHTNKSYFTKNRALKKIY